MRFALLLCMMVIISGMAIHAGEITIKDSSGIPLERCAIQYSPLDKQSQTTGKPKVLYTNKQGVATIPFSGRVLIRISRIGFRSVADTLYANQSKTYILQSDALMASGVVVTAQYAPQDQRQSLYKVQVIDNERLQKQAAVTLRDALSQVLNIRLSQDNILGSGMSMQGISGENVKILIDGVPVIGRQNGNIDLQQLQLSSIERIEIVEGPLSTIYGTNALAGAINLITKKASAQPQAYLKGYWESVGAIGQANIDASVQASLGETQLALSGGRYFFGGYANPDTSRWKQWKPREQYTANLGLTHRFDDVDVRWQNGFFHDVITNRGTPRQPYYETAFDDYYTTRRMNSSLFVTSPLSESFSMQFTAAYSHYLRRKNTYYRNLVTLEQTLTSDAGTQDTSAFQAILLRGVLTQHQDDAVVKYQAGFDVNIESGSGERLQNNFQQLGDYALFASMQYSPINEITLQPALRAGYNTGYASPLVPALNIKAQVGSDIVLRASYAHGFRAPALKELYLFFVDINHNIQGNSALRAENSRNLLVSADALVAGAVSVWKFEVSGFYNALRNMISLAAVDSNLYTYVNLESYSTLGARIGIQYRTQNLNAQVGAAYTGRYNQYSAIYAVQHYLYTPELNALLGYTLPFLNDLQANLFLKYTGRLPQVQVKTDGSIGQGFVESYTLIDATLSKELWGTSLVVSMGGKNLLNVQNIQASASSDGSAHTSSASSLPVSWGRTFFLQLQYTLQ